MKDRFVPNHLHLLVKGYMKQPPMSEEALNIFFKDLVRTVRMKVVAGPTSIYIDEPGNEGVTGTVTLATSHASMHVWSEDKPPMFQFDLYSCTEYSPEEVLGCLNKHFELIETDWIFIDRNGTDFHTIRRS